MLRRFALILGFFWLSATLYAQDKTKFEGLLNKLLAPGPLIQGHENLEHKDCLECHEAGGGVPNTQCMNCHKDIRADVNANKGFHGKMNNKPCIECHKDHKGRNYDSTKVDPDDFDHSKTGFLLEGGHAKPKCEDCHKEKRTDKAVRKNEPRFGATSDSCRSCHAKDDVHFFTTKKFQTRECGTCHGIEKWKDPKDFNHEKETGYKLEGKHARIKCADCHVPKGKASAKYDWPTLKTTKCLNCHKDQHKDNLSARFRGGACDKCHNQNEWKIDKFNHDVTTWPLKGKHAEQRCEDCHKQDAVTLRQGLKDFDFKGLTKNCGSCHADYHGFAKEKSPKLGQLTNCASCHNEMAWKQNIDFDHNKQTTFPITGKHKEVKCFECHKTLQSSVKGKPNEPRDYDFSEMKNKNCETCHKDPHNQDFHRKFKGIKCDGCHTTEGWGIFLASGFGRDKNFHDRTRFPLTGKHKEQKCSECHTVNGKEVYKFPNFEKKFCVNCHLNVHEKQFNRETQNRSCAECHTTLSFGKLLPFNHDQTRFKLTGAHVELERSCRKCHVETEAKLPTNPPQVAHKFMFGAADRGFCESCHKNVHKEQFHPQTAAQTCESCHTTKSFKTQPNFNHDDTHFRLTGKHAEIEKQCIKCHVNSELIIPTSPPRNGHLFVFKEHDDGMCVNCHKNEHKDMFHKEFYAKPCTECHTTLSFQKRKPFDHDKTSFELNGKHTEVKCLDCHKRTPKRFEWPPQNAKGKYLFPEIPSKDCQTCHKDPHKGSYGPKCSSCHNEKGWKLASDFHRENTLHGVHLTLSCESCHGNKRVQKGASDECSVCHAKDDPHGGNLSRCQDCHSQTFWSATNFSHNMTMFPLQGAHRTLDCKACHNGGTYNGLSSDCVSCHYSDSANVTAPDHSSPRYQSCGQCHNQYIFK